MWVLLNVYAKILENEPISLWECSLPLNLGGEVMGRGLELCFRGQCFCFCHTDFSLFPVIVFGDLSSSLTISWDMAFEGPRRCFEQLVFIPNPLGFVIRRHEEIESPVSWQSQS